MPPETEKKKGFGEKLKGVGKAIGRQLKKVPGVAYRDVVKPYAQHMADKFTEPAVSSPTLKRTIDPGTSELFKAAKTTVSRKEAPTVEPYRAEQRTRLKRGPGKVRAARGKTTAYDRPAGSLTAVGRLNKLAEEKAKAAGTAPKAAPKKEVISPTPEKKPTPSAATPGSAATPRLRGEYVEVIGGLEPKSGPKPPPVRGMQRAKKRKFSPKRTGATLTKAAEKRREDIAKAAPKDTTAQEMARLMIEQEVGREAERAEAALKGGRKPQREKARYRLRTRGYKRSEGRSR